MNVSINSVQNDSDHASTERKSRERLSPKPIEPDPAVWKDKNTYGNALIERFLEPLRAAKLEFGPVPQALQNSVLLQLHWYFTTDLRERSPTVVVTEPMAVEFHALVKEIMSYIEVDTISAIDENLVSQEVKHAILSYKGVMYKKHLLGGVAKGAFDEAAADAKFEKWMSEKAAKISAKTQKLTGEKEKSEKARLAAEKEANEKKAKAIEAKRAEAAAAAAAQTEEAEAPAEGEAPAAE